jgi:pyruvate formate lyase activating enzyme
MAPGMEGGGWPPAAYWEPREGGRTACLLCPHACVMAPGKSGLCRVRSNEGGALALPFQGGVSSLAVDPIEKKPLHHFLPGSTVFSAGFLGCNLRCPFCQNWEISQGLERPVTSMSPRSLVEAALDSGCPSIAYTYSEPLVHFEFVLASMRLAREAGLRNVLVTNGCLAAEPARELLAWTDAANVDLKCWSPEAYERELGGELPAVLAFIRLAASTCHLEVTTLVVPALSDFAEDVDSIAGFLAGLSPDIALHLSAYRPAWKHHAPPTSPETLRALRARARERLHHVYVGNVSGEGADTRCPSCGALVVRRRGYDTLIAGLSSRATGNLSRCSGCGADLPIIIR